MWPKKPKKNPLSPSKKKPTMDSVVNEISRPSTSSSTLKIGSPTIRVGLNAAKGAPKSSMIKMIGSAKNPTLTNDASNPKSPKAVKVPKATTGKMVGPKPPKSDY
jgi:hypothetical protein